MRAGASSGMGRDVSAGANRRACTPWQTGPGMRRTPPGGTAQAPRHLRSPEGSSRAGYGAGMRLAADREGHSCPNAREAPPCCKARHHVAGIRGGGRPCGRCKHAGSSRRCRRCRGLKLRVNLHALARRHNASELRARRTRPRPRLRGGVRQLLRGEGQPDGRNDDRPARPRRSGQRGRAPGPVDSRRCVGARIGHRSARHGQHPPLRPCGRPPTVRSAKPVAGSSRLHGQYARRMAQPDQTRSEWQRTGRHPQHDRLQPPGRRTP